MCCTWRSPARSQKQPPARASIDNREARPHHVCSFGHHRSILPTSACQAVAASTGTTAEFSTVNPDGAGSLTSACAGSDATAVEIAINTIQPSFRITTHLPDLIKTCLVDVRLPRAQL